MSTKRSSSPMQELPRKKRLSVDIANHDNDDPSENESSTNKLLKEIRDLLKTRKEKEPRCDSDKDNEMRKDWMLAADVVNHVSAIVFTVVLVGGTLVFFVLFAVHP